MALKRASEVDPRKLVGARVRITSIDKDFTRWDVVHLVRGVLFHPPWDDGYKAYYGPHCYGLLIEGKHNDAWSGKQTRWLGSDAGTRWPEDVDASWVPHCFEVISLGDDWDE